MIYPFGAAAGFAAGAFAPSFGPGGLAGVALGLAGVAHTIRFIDETNSSYGHDYLMQCSKLPQK